MFLEDIERVESFTDEQARGLAVVERRGGRCDCDDGAFWKRHGASRVEVEWVSKMKLQPQVPSSIVIFLDRYFVSLWNRKLSYC